MERSTLIPTHSVAEWLLNTIDRILDALGMTSHGVGEEIVYIIIVVAGAFLIGWLFKKLIFFIVEKIVQHTHGTIGHELIKWHTLSRISLLLPPLIMLGLIPFAFESTHVMRSWIMRIVGVYGMIMLGIALCAVLDFIFNHYNVHDNKKNLPVRGVLNVGKGIVWIVITICAVATILDKSPAYLLTGLGAFAAALMLIFKDSILGFVAGIQMSQNDMLHVGDWILVPGTPANGIVLDMSLSTVKVQNFDNTIVTVPPYTLVSTSFQNYRGMKETGARRITKTFTIDYPSVRKLTQEEAQAMAAPFPRLKDFVDNLIKNGQTAQNDGGLTPINGSIETNVGLFRAYLSLYIYYNSDMTMNQQLLVRLMDPSDSGVPLQVYCFTNTTDWDKYEAIQSDLIEHVLSHAADFGLVIYSSGSISVDVDSQKSQADAQK